MCRARRVCRMFQAAGKGEGHVGREWRMACGQAAFARLTGRKKGGKA